MDVKVVTQSQRPIYYITRGVKETADSYLAAVRDGDPDGDLPRRKLEFERCLEEALLESDQNLSEAEFAEEALVVLREAADTYNLPMDNNYQGVKPDLNDKSDHYPLTKDKLTQLLREANSSNDPDRLVAIQGRLVQAVPGMTSPEPRSGPVFEISWKVQHLYVHQVGGLTEDKLSEVVNEIYSLIAPANSTE